MAIERVKGKGVFNNSMVRGEHGRLAKLTRPKVVRIWVLLQRGECPLAEIARRFKTSKANVSNIKARRTWRHVTAGLGPIPQSGSCSWVNTKGQNNPNAKLSDAQARQVFKDAHNGVPLKVIAKKRGISQGTASNIKTGKRYAHATLELRLGGAA